MSIRIDVNIGDERLRRNNKRRTAANQQALDARTQSVDDRQAAEQAAQEATPVERPGAVPDLRIQRRPAAQRRRDKYDLEVGVVSIDFADLKNFVTEQAQSDWTALMFSNDTEANVPDREILTCPPDRLSSTPYQLGVRKAQVWNGIGLKSNNVFTHIGRELFFNLYRSLPSVETYAFRKVKLMRVDRILTSGFSQGGSVAGGTVPLIINWIVKQGLYPEQEPQEWVQGCTFEKVFTTSGKRSNPPAFPLDHFRRGIYTNYRVISSTDTYTYISYLINSNKLYPTERVMGTLTGFLSYNYQYGSEIPSYLRSASYVFEGYHWKVAALSKTVEWYGVYIRQNNKTLELETRVQIVSSRDVFFGSIATPNISEPITNADAAAFGYGMYQDDPRRKMFVSTGNTQSVTREDWNPLLYDPKTGVAAFTLMTSSSNIQIYVAEPQNQGLPKGLNYEQALEIILNARKSLPFSAPLTHRYQNYLFTRTKSFPRQSTFLHAYPVLTGL